MYSLFFASKLIYPEISIHNINKERKTYYGHDDKKLPFYYGTESLFQRSKVVK